MTTELTPPENHPSEIVPTKDEQALIDDLIQLHEQSRQLAETAVDEIKKKLFWETGKRIKKQLLKNKSRAEYGHYFYDLLSKSLRIGRSNLYLCAQFYETYPKIVRISGQLTWSHYAILLSVHDIAARDTLEKRIISEHLTYEQLKEIVRHSKPLPSPDNDQKLEVERTAPYVYELSQINGIDMIDLGFNFCIESPEQNNKAKAAVQFGSVPHNTYKAFVIEVLDGDTVWVNIDLGMKGWTTQKLRLRGVNSAEIVTAEGKTAKDHMVNVLEGCKFIAVKTYWRDKFTRYLADIFYDKNETDLAKLVQSGKFLNQELLDEGYAVEY